MVSCLWDHTLLPQDAGLAALLLSNLAVAHDADDCRLQVTYRTAPQSSFVSQLTLYNSYRTRFDPYAVQAPLLGGQDLVNLACATFAGCEMARDEGEYVLRGLKEQGINVQDEWDKGMDSLVEPLRASTW
jgi:hypothetical protein